MSGRLFIFVSMVICLLAFGAWYFSRVERCLARGQGWYFAGPEIDPRSECKHGPPMIAL